MRQRLIIFLGLILLIAVLVGLNAASYQQKEKTPDSEANPNRSTHNSGTTGMQAYFSLLNETGHNAVRWLEPPGALLTGKKPPSVFVVIGAVRREFTDTETTQLLRWVSNGGRLVVIDREPPEELVTTTTNWKIAVDSGTSYQLFGVDPSDEKQMTGEMPAVKPSEPGLLTQSVNAIQPSQFASAIRFERVGDSKTPAGKITPTPKASVTPDDEQYDDDSEDGSEPPRPLSKISTVQGSTDVGTTDAPAGPPAPVAYFAYKDTNLLVEAPFGSGKIIYLADPYIVSNAGIGIVDNAQLAVNLVASQDAIIAFDEYHQGFGAENNEFLKFFEGTPVVAIFFQGLLLVALVFYSQSRRFGRPVPEPEPDRLSKLEYVLAMAELEQRSRAYDLAIENIYNDFRRRAARLLGADNLLTKYEELARLIAERTGLDARVVADTLFKCEDIIRGEPTNKREVVKLIAAVREIEQKLGLSRAAKQRTGQ